MALLVLSVHEVNVVAAPPTSPSMHFEDVGGTTGTVLQPSETAQAYMTMLTDSGLSEEQAAAMVGHLKVESDNFQADLEYVPNAYGTRGRGHLQWTDSGDSGGRRSNFEAYATSKDLSPTSFEANSGFLLSEIQGNHGQHWTSGASYQGFLQTALLRPLPISRTITYDQVCLIPSDDSRLQVTPTVPSRDKRTHSS